MTHHLQALVVVTRSTLRIPVLWLTIVIKRDLTLSMRTMNSRERLALRFEHVQSCVFVPAVNEVSVQTVTFANLRGRLA